MKTQSQSLQRQLYVHVHVHVHVDTHLTMRAYIDHGLYVSGDCARTVRADDAKLFHGDEPVILRAVQHRHHLLVQTRQQLKRLRPVNTATCGLVVTKRYGLKCMCMYMYVRT